MNELKSMHEKKFACVFFDIFDTIVYRTVQPEFTKKIWANNIIKRLDINYSMIDLYHLRSDIESKLGEKTHNEGYDWEFTYENLIKNIYKNISSYINISLEKFMEISIEVEIDIESSVQKPYKEIISEIKKAKKEGKKIYCISDMYLSKKMIKDIFANIGIIDLFDDFFISCEYLYNKKSGILYDIVLKKLNAKAENCIMIGDNESSDYTNPVSKGIKAIKLNREKKYKDYDLYLEKHSEELIYERFNILKKTSRDSFEHAIFTLYLFIEKLYNSLLKNNLDEVFFLSREGEFLKKLFDDYVEKIIGKKIKSHYILVSRKATYLPSLKKLEEEDFGTLLNQYLNSSINEFLSSLNFTEKEKEIIYKSFQEECKKIKINNLSEFDRKAVIEISQGNFDYKIVYLYGSVLLKLLKKNNEFKKIYETNRKNQKQLFKKYICQFTSNKRVCVVDIGWNGSIQDNIQRILGNEYDVTGYLYGLVSRDPKNDNNNKQGLIFSNSPKNTNNYYLFFENRAIYEIILGASHGSADKYYIEKDNKVYVSTFEKNEEKEIYNKIISKIQKRMFEIFIEIEDIFENGFYNNIKIEKEINRIHFDMLFRPTTEQLKFFNKIYHYENFGVFEFSEFNLKKKLTIKFYIKENAKYFLKRKHFFDDSFWPTLKLYNEKLYIPKLLYTTRKKIQLKIKGVI